MKNHQSQCLAACFIAFNLCLLFLGGIFSCGGNSAILNITPPSVTVKKGQVQQFSVNMGNPTWSVVGGSNNGTIDAKGLYTPPPLLPIDPQVAVTATVGPQTVSATVNLVTGDSISFSGSALRLNTDSSRPDDEGIANSGVIDKLAAGSGAHLLSSIWTGGANAHLFFNQDINPFSGFGGERDLTPSSTSALALAIELLPDQNPVILFSEQNQTKFLGSPDQGLSFGNPVVIHPPNPSTDFQFQAALKTDPQGLLHVIFTEGPNSGVGFFPINGSLFYTQSADGGATWSSHPTMIASTGTSAVLADPDLALDSKGNIYACYSVDSDGFGGPDKFELFLAKSTDGGATFSNVNLTNTPGSDELFCRIGFSPSGSVYLSYAGGDLGALVSNIFFIQSADGGMTFSTPKIVNSDPAGDLQFSFLSIDPLGRIDVVWSQDTNGDQGLDSLFYSRSLDGGTAFSPNQKIAGGPPALGALGMGLRHDSAGRLHLQFASDILDPGIGIDVFYFEAE